MLVETVRRLPRARAAALPLLAPLALLALPATAVADTGWPTAVTARYKLFFAGFEVGSYDFNSSIQGKSYSATGAASVSALFGAFKWKGGIKSSGTLDPAKPHPIAYNLDFKAKKKRGSVTLTFDRDAVKSVNVLPEKPPHPSAVPVKPEELKGVFDPMSSILAITHAGGADPCTRTIPIFDGKARFNLVMSPKGVEPLHEAKASGQPAQLKVCRVKYVPISGHKPKDFVNPWVDYDGIEISLRPVPTANVFVPYQVTIPTTIGAAVMLADAVNITASNNVEIALRR